MAFDMKKWLADLESYVDSIPYGKIEIPEIERVNRRVVSITTTASETLRYEDNAEAVKDILGFLTTLVDDGHNGRVKFEVEYKNGQIKLLAIQNSRKTHY